MQNDLLIWLIVVARSVVLDMPYQIRALNANANATQASGGAQQLARPLANCLGKLNLARLALRAVADFYFFSSQNNVCFLTILNKDVLKLFI